MQTDEGQLQGLCCSGMAAEKGTTCCLVAAAVALSTVCTLCLTLLAQAAHVVSHEHSESDACTHTS